MNYAAYESEIYRGALEAVSTGQLEAARTLGLSERQVLTLVRAPQAFRLALAPMTNDFIALLKDSSLVSVLTVLELTKQTQIFATNLGSWVIPGSLCAALYLAMFGLCTVVQVFYSFTEQRFGLFWRAWLPRWIDRAKDFREVPLGQYSRAAFWLTAILFASEHGALWDVGLAAGLLYNWWMRRTRSLGDLILAHAVTNACLSVYVLTRGRWEYW